MEMPKLISPKLTSLLLGTMILLSPVVSALTACADTSAKSDPMASERRRLNGSTPLIILNLSRGRRYPQSGR